MRASTPRPLAAWRIPSVRPLGVEATLRLASMVAPVATASSLGAVAARSIVGCDSSSGGALAQRSGLQGDLWSENRG